MKKPLVILYALVAILFIGKCAPDVTSTTKPQLSSPLPNATSTDMASPSTSESSDSSTVDPSLNSEVLEPVSDSSALIAAQVLEERGKASTTDYNRSAFGSAWKDVDRNGCDTRNDILARDFSEVKFKPGTNSCKVIGGVWTDPYSNETYTFNSAPSTAQIDHVVSLKNAWQMGADQWAQSDREAFANDPLNLRVTVASLNRQKSDSNAASWLPPYKPARCSFIARQVAVKTKWKLYVTTSEKAVMLQILSMDICDGTELPK